MTKYPCEASNPYGALQSSEELRLGDTPQQLNTKQANLADVIVVDGIVYDEESIRGLLARFKEIAKQYTVLALQGVYYTLEELKQRDLELRAKAWKDGYVSGFKEGGKTIKQVQTKQQLLDKGIQYVAKVREGGE